MTVRLISDDARLVRRVRAGSVPDDTAYHEPVSLGASVSKRQAEGAFTFGPAANDAYEDEDGLWFPCSSREDATLLCLVLLFVVLAALALFFASDIYAFFSTWRNLK